MCQQWSEGSADEIGAMVEHFKFYPGGGHMDIIGYNSQELIDDMLAYFN